MNAMFRLPYSFNISLTCAKSCQSASRFNFANSIFPLFLYVSRRMEFAISCGLFISYQVKSKSVYILIENMENIYLASLVILIIVLLFAGISYAIVYTLNELYETADSLLKKRIITAISIILLLSFLYSLPILVSHL